MKKIIQIGKIQVALLFLVVVMFGCKGLDDNSTTKVTIDISGLTNNLATSSSSATTDGPSQVSSPTDSAAQTPVATLLVAPLTFVNHGGPYSEDDFDKDTEADFEDDAANSANFIKFIQLPTTGTTVEVDIPTVSGGWQLIAAATTTKVTSADDLDGDTVKVAYIGFTEQAYTSADDFASDNPTLVLKRNCDQDEQDRPKGCATFDSNQDAIVTSSVEIHGVDINGIAQTPGVGFPWVVKASPTGGQISTTDAETRLNALVGAFGSTITSITVYVTHQDSASKSAACEALDASSDTSDFVSACGTLQENTRKY